MTIPGQGEHHPSSFKGNAQFGTGELFLSQKCFQTKRCDADTQAQSTCCTMTWLTFGPAFCFVCGWNGTAWEQHKTPCAQQNSKYGTTVPSLTDSQGALIPFRVKRHWEQSHLLSWATLIKLQTWKSHLSTELEIHHDNADLGAGYHQNYKHQEEEAKKVIELVLPDCLK